MIREIEHFASDEATLRTTTVRLRSDPAWMAIYIIGGTCPSGDPIPAHSGLFSQAGTLIELFPGDTTGARAEAAASNYLKNEQLVLVTKYLCSINGYHVFLEWYALFDGHHTPVGTPSTVVYTPDGKRLLIGKRLAVEAARALIQRLIAEQIQFPEPRQ